VLVAAGSVSTVTSWILWRAKAGLHIMGIRFDPTGSVEDEGADAGLSHLELLGSRQQLNFGSLLAAARSVHSEVHFRLT